MRLRNVSITIGIFILLIAFNRAYDQVRSDEQINIIQLASYQNESSLLGLPVRVKLKVLLQGCYSVNDGQMSTFLNSGSYLPLTSPYCEDQRTVSAIPSNITDWVLVQLHSSFDGAPVASQSAFLRQDGYIVADDGTTNILVTAPPGNYYVAVVHRNHLTIVTNSAIALNSDTAALYDFTNSIAKCYGINGLVELEPGIWGMWAGDINHDGIVTTRDYKIWFKSYRTGTTGYQSSDVNRDGLADNQDYLIWLSNAQKGATCPVQRVGDEPVICLWVNSLDFGVWAVGSTVDKILLITNVGTADLHVSSIGTSDAAYSIIGSASFSMAPGGYQDITVRFAPSAGPHNATLHINNNSVENVKDVALIGEGVDGVTDIDGNIYKIIKIGDQLWMAENLKVTRYRNGEVIPEVADANSWSDLTSGAYCEYENNESNVDTYGRLYNWHAINDRRGLAPTGWYLPSDSDWQVLVDYLGGDAIAGGKLKEAGTTHWLPPNTGATNESGFTGLPGGSRTPSIVGYGYLGSLAHFWTSSEILGNNAYFRPLASEDTYAGHWGVPKQYGFSVRCYRPDGPLNTNPTPFFIITPSPGTTDQAISFDASGCTDNEDPSSTLQVRWDWTNDGIWDTDYNVSKIAVNEYLTAGTYTIALEVKDSGGLKNMTTAQVVIYVNRQPLAAFTMNPGLGTTSTLFQFNASGCTDAWDPPDSLRIRWDWNNDGVWDEGFSTTKTAMHQYLAAGSYTIMLEVKDTGGLTNSFYKIFTILEDSFETGTLTDYDGNIYLTLKIGDQWWMAENLKVTHYRNGDPISYAPGGVWPSLFTGAQGFYSNNEEYVLTYGRMYNWYAVGDSRGLAPIGWHVPSRDEWQILVDYLGGDAIAGGKLKEAGTTHWLPPNTGATNESGFTGLPGGGRDGQSGMDGGVGGGVSFWSSTETSIPESHRLSLEHNNSVAMINTSIMRTGCYIRCVKD